MKNSNFLKLLMKLLNSSPNSILILTQCQDLQCLFICYIVIFPDDIELVRGKAESPGTPNLKKSRSLGGSLRKLFRRGRKQSRSHGETSRESSFSRSSTRNVSQGPSRDGSLNRNADPKDMQYQQTLIS